jgi:transposase
MEKFYFEAERGERTKVFDDFVRFSRWHMSWAQIARNTQCSPRTTHDILSWIDENMLNKRWIEIMNELKEIYLWIDEHSFHGRDMVLVITDIKAKKVLAILDNITNEILNNRFNGLSQEIKNKIKWISTDMNKWYKNVAEQKIPGIIGTVDKYHLVQEANRMVDDVRWMTIWLIKMWFMTEEDFIKHKKITSTMIKKKEKIK